MTDTQALVWYLTEDRRLSRRAKEVFEKAEGGKAKILIPIVSLFEILSLIWRRRISFRHLDEIKIRIETINERFEEDPPYQFAQLDDKILYKTIEISQINTPNRTRVNERDLMIVAMALVNESVLITNDLRIRNSGIVTFLW